MNSQADPDAGRCLSAGWHLFRKEPLLLTGATVLIALANALVSWIPFANLVLGPPLLGSLYLMIARIDRDEPVTLGNLADGFRYLIPLVIASVLVSLIVGIGMVLLLIPGLYFALAYGLTSLMIVDRNMEFWPAMEGSRRAVTGAFWSYLLLSIMLFVVLIIGMIPFGLGLFVAVPVCLAAQYSFYKELDADDDSGVLI